MTTTSMSTRLKLILDPYWAIMTGAEFRTLRQTIRCSAKTIADMAHIHAQTIRRWENGHGCTISVYHAAVTALAAQIERTIQENNKEGGQ